MALIPAGSSPAVRFKEKPILDSYLSPWLEAGLKTAWSLPYRMIRKFTIPGDDPYTAPRLSHYPQSVR